MRSTLVLAVILAVPAGGALAQPATPAAPAPQAAPEPALLRLPMGARVRLQTGAQASWIKGVLASADSASVALVPEGAPPFAESKLSIPSAAVTRFELQTGTKRRWLPGLIAGTALGVLLGVTAEVNPDQCGPYDYAFCSRGEALAAGVLVLGGVGAGVGALVKTERWTPVALDALGPPPARVSGARPQIRALPGGGVSLGLAVGF